MDELGQGEADSPASPGVAELEEESEVLRSQIKALAEQGRRSELDMAVSRMCPGYPWILDFALVQSMQEHIGTSWNHPELKQAIPHPGKAPLDAWLAAQETIDKDEAWLGGASGNGLDFPSCVFFCVLSWSVYVCVCPGELLQPPSMLSVGARALAKHASWHKRLPGALRNCL